MQTVTVEILLFTFHNISSLAVLKKSYFSITHHTVRRSNKIIIRNNLRKKIFNQLPSRKLVNESEPEFPVKYLFHLLQQVIRLVDFSKVMDLFWRLVLKRNFSF